MAIQVIDNFLDKDCFNKIKTSMTNALSTAKMLLSQRSKYKQKVNDENQNDTENN